MLGLAIPASQTEGHVPPLPTLQEALPPFAGGGPLGTGQGALSRLQRPVRGPRSSRPAPSARALLSTHPPAGVHPHPDRPPGPPLRIPEVPRGSHVPCRTSERSTVRSLQDPEPSRPDLRLRRAPRFARGLAAQRRGPPGSDRRLPAGCRVGGCCHVRPGGPGVGIRRSRPSRRRREACGDGSGHGRRIPRRHLPRLLVRLGAEPREPLRPASDPTGGNAVDSPGRGVRSVLALDHLPDPRDIGSSRLRPGCHDPRRFRVTRRGWAVRAGLRVPVRVLHPQETAGPLLALPPRGA